MIEVEKLKGWLPVDAVLRGGRPHVEWMDMNGVVLSEPFFQQTVERVGKTHAHGAALLTDINALIQLEKITDSLRPTGFIFHASRCGSTLVSNACGALRDALVFSEPRAADKLLGHFFLPGVGEGFQSHIWEIFLRGAVSALGQRRSGLERHFFIKFSCCGALQMDRVRRIWPDAPFVFVYRDPFEIMVSNMKNVPDWMRVEGQEEHTAAMLGVTPCEVLGMSGEEFCARALGKFYEAAGGRADAKTLLLDYEQISARSLLEVVRFFGITPSHEEVEAVKRVSRLYSKDTRRRRGFEADAVSKRDEASPLIKEMAGRWASEPYERLRAKARQARTTSDNTRDAQA